jgi:hypothetical protein
MVKRKHASSFLALAFAWMIGTTGFAYAADVTLAWDANTEENLAGYKVHYGRASGNYDGAGSGSEPSPITVPLSSLVASSPEFTVRDLPDGTYYFVVTAFNTDGLESGYSNEVSAEIASTTPSPPQNSAPVLSSLMVNGQGGDTVIYTNSRNVEVQIVASDDDGLVSEYLILDGRSDPESGTFQLIPGDPRQNAIFTIKDFVLNDADGSRTIYAWVKDDQGLISAVAAKSGVVLERASDVVDPPAPEDPGPSPDNTSENLDPYPGQFVPIRRDIE